MKGALLRAAAAVATVLAVLILENILISAYAPHTVRLATDFSPAFLERKLTAMAAASPDAVFLGDSVLWGYAVPPERTAIGLLARDGCYCVNLALKAGSPANDYALVKLFAEYGVRPKLVAIEINQRAFNPADPSYKTLHPALIELAGPLLSPSDRAALTPQASEAHSDAMLDGLLSGWLPYASRTDLRASLLGDTDAPPATLPTSDQFLGTYDMTPLTEDNLSVRFLGKTIDELHGRNVAVAAFMTPTNETLVRDLVDDPAYLANARYLKAFLQRRGVKVIDLERGFPSEAFFDNSHLTIDGQRRLADALSRRLLDSRP